jgi:hypothetical protein
MIDWDFVWTLVVAFTICLVIYYVEKALWQAITGRNRTGRNRRR